MTRRTTVKRLAVALILLLLASVATILIRPGEPVKPKAAGSVPVVSTEVTAREIPVRLSSTGTVTAVQSVDVRAQISATIRAVHVREGQSVRQGDRLFSLDVRTEAANLGKAEAQVAKSRADLANAERNLQRQRELFGQKFISQTALDASQNQVDSLNAQVAADLATVASTRVAQGFGEIFAPIAGRIGAITVYPGSLVQPSGQALLGITQIDPINISFTLPERELAGLRAAMDKGPVAVTARAEEGSDAQGRLSFIDNSVDSGSGTIRLKALFANGDSRLWPGMFVTVALTPRTLANALVVPVQAVQTGPERKFLYAIDAAGKVSQATVRILLVQDGIAVIEGVAAGTRVVVEGAQNLRPGATVSEGGAEQKPARP